MKTLRLVLSLMPLWLLTMTRPAAAGPAAVLMFPEDGTCFIGWAGIDSGGNLVPVVLLPGKGVLVESNNSRGSALSTCSGQIDFGATTVAVDFATGNPVSVRLLTIAEECSLDPAACRGGGNGALIFGFDNTGILCPLDGGVTTRWSERVTPSGQAQITCHLPE